MAAQFLKRYKVHLQKGFSYNKIIKNNKKKVKNEAVKNWTRAQSAELSIK